MSSIKKSKFNVLMCEQQSHILFLFILLSKDKSNHLTINGLSYDEINYMIEFNTTS